MGIKTYIYICFHLYCWKKAFILASALVKSLKTYKITLVFRLLHLVMKTLKLTNIKKLTLNSAAARSLQSCLTFCDTMNCSPPGACVRGILQARILEWVAIPFSRRSFQLRDRIWISCIAGQFFTIWVTIEGHLLEWQKSKTLIPPNAGKATNQKLLSFIASGNSKYFSYLKDRLAVIFYPKI